MTYGLCVIGCGTMGVSVLSGVLDNLASPKQHLSTLDDSAPSTPMGSMILEKPAGSTPDRFVFLRF